MLEEVALRKRESVHSRRKRKAYSLKILTPTLLSSSRRGKEGVPSTGSGEKADSLLLEKAVDGDHGKALEGSLR